ncbi:unnamed protein product, partial [Candidula unifasciata]
MTIDFSDASRIVCYFTNWSQYRSGEAKFLPANIDMIRCTHVMYAYAKPEGLNIKPTQPNDESTPRVEGLYSRLMKVRRKNPNVKVLLSVGGRKVGPKPFAPVVKSEDAMSTFAKNVISFLRKRQFDGLDMAWEYPEDSDKSKFQNLMEEIMKAFEREASRTGKERLLLSVAVPPFKSQIDDGYDVEDLSRTVDFMSIRSFDFHGDWSSGVGFNSPLYAHPDESGEETQHNVDWVARYYVSLGAPKSLLNIGIPTYARTFTLKDPDRHSVGSPFRGKGRAGPLTKEAGILAYFEVCNIMGESEVIKVASQRNYYAVQDGQWVGFEGVESVNAKACYAAQNGYGGILIWSSDLDDFEDTECKQGVDPLLKAAHEAINDPSSECEEEEDEPITTKRRGTTSTTPRPETITEAPVSDYYRTICYFTNWSQFRKGKGKFLPENINPNLCSHIIYASAKLERLDLQPVEENEDSTESKEGMYAQVIKLKEKNPNIKVLLSVGGSYLGSDPFKPVVESLEDMSLFASNVASFLRKREFDGLDMDWQYPADILTTPEDKPKFQHLMEELMKEFEREAKKTSKTRLMLTLAGAPDKENIDKSYYLANLSRIVDFITIMSFDLHGAWEDVVGFNSPLYSHPDEQDPASQLCVDWIAKYYVSLGAPKELLNIGIATYGRSFKLKDPEKHTVLSAAIGKGNAGPITEEEGIMAYFE